jgi:hypothetical protein
MYFPKNPVSTYSASCGANCVDTFSAKVSSADVVSEENVDFINGNCTDATTGFITCNFNSGIFTVTPNCTAISQANGRVRLSSQSASSVTFITYDSAESPSNQGIVIICQKQGADFVATRTIQGTFNEVNVSPGISKPKTCHYAFGGASATLAVPTECTTGTCVEMYDSCGTGSPPVFSAVGIYGDLTWSSGTWSNSSFIKCDCRAYNTTTSLIRECNNYFVTGDNTITTNLSGGYVTNINTAARDGINSNEYAVIQCTGSAP